MTAMSRKFYQALAAKFKSQRPSDWAPGYPMWFTMVLGAANVIAEGNPAFDSRRFLDASGFGKTEFDLLDGNT